MGDFHHRKTHKISLKKTGKMVNVVMDPTDNHPGSLRTHCSSYRNGCWPYVDVKKSRKTYQGGLIDVRYPTVERMLEILNVMKTHWFTWFCLVGDFITDCTMVHHHFSPPFGRNFSQASYIKQIQVHFCRKISGHKFRKFSTPRP